MLNLCKKRLMLVGVLPMIIAGIFISLVAKRGAIRPDPDRLQNLEDPGQGACPTGTSDSEWGPDMVRLPEGFCIDTTEVTRGQYEAWLDTSPAMSGQTSACSGNEDFIPSCHWQPGSDENKPVVCVDWCDAKAFCDAVGKRLCGRIGDGGGYLFESYDDVKVSEWYAACTSGGNYAYPYGNELDTTTCRGADAEDYTTWGLGGASADATHPMTCIVMFTT